MTPTDPLAAPGQFRPQSDPVFGPRLVFVPDRPEGQVAQVAVVHHWPGATDADLAAFAAWLVAAANAAKAAERAADPAVRVDAPTTPDPFA